MNFNLIAAILSTMSLTAGAALTAPFLLAVYYEEPMGGADFLLVMFICLVLSFELKRRGRYIDTETTTLSVREGIAITGLGWILMSLLGMLPYLFSGYMSPLDCFVESVSGFSGTGATVIEDVEALPRSILLWRSLTNWIGGLGIIVIFMAILPQMGRGAMYMFRAESSGPTKDRQLPRIKDNAKALFLIYVVFTASCAIVYMLCGLGWFSALNHALTTIATGGFSIYNDGITVYANPALEFCMAFFMIISSASFAMYVVAWRQGVHVIWQNTEFRVYLMVVAGASALIALDLYVEMGLESWDVSTWDVVRYAMFHVASISSTTAFVTYDFDVWPAFSKCILLLLMFMGGCAGSTSGGLKISRMVLLVKMVQSVVWQKLHPQIVYQVRMNGRVVPEEVLFSVARFFFAYMMVDMAFATVLIFDGVSMTEAVNVAVSTLGSVGPGFGLEGAMSTYALLSPTSKVFACVVMFLGRLEIFTVVALFTPEFWSRKKGW